jgi:hypothetical protein
MLAMPVKQCCGQTQSLHCIRAQPFVHAALLSCTLEALCYTRIAYTIHVLTAHYAFIVLLSCTALYLANSGLVVYHRQPPATVPEATAAAIDSNECSSVCSNHVPFAALKVSHYCAPVHSRQVLVFNIVAGLAVRLVV